MDIYIYIYMLILQLRKILWRFQWYLQVTRKSNVAVKPLGGGKPGQLIYKSAIFQPSLIPSKTYKC